VPSPPRSSQRVAVYAWARRGDATLLARAGDGGAVSLPGGVVEHGEHPRAAMQRALVGLGVVALVGPVVGTLSDVAEVPDPAGAGPSLVHTVGLLYGVELGEARLPTASPWAPFLAPRADLARQRLTGVAALALGVPAALADLVLDPPLPALRDEVAPVESAAAADEPEPVPLPVVQRPAAYARVVADGKVLLTRLAHFDGLWTLPGGGIDFGEHPTQALIREVHEESGLPFTPGRLLDVDSRRFTGHGPGGRLEDFHGIRLVFDGQVPPDVEPHVVEVGGSTDAAAWVPVGRLERTPLTSLAAGVLSGLG